MDSFRTPAQRYRGSGRFPRPRGRCTAACLALAIALGPAAPAPRAQQPADPAAEEQVVDPVAEAKALVRQGDYAAAAGRLDPLIDDATDDVALLALYGEVLVATGRMEDAVPVLERVAVAAPERPRVNFQLATALSRLGRRDRALQAFAAEIEVNDDPQVLYMARLNRSILLKQERRWSDAAAELEQALVADPEHPDFYGELATLYLETDDADAAMDALERGSAAGFRSARLYFNVGAHLYNSKRYEQAEDAFRRALRIDPEMAEAERSLGSTLTQSGRAREAARHFERYLELRPDAPDAREIRTHVESAGR